ncbi:MAG: RecX family transcriptional regulator [Oscillospiraceae bacterium]
MVVTDITRTQRGRYSIFLDDEFFAALHIDVYVASGIKIDDNVTEQQMLDLKAQSEGKITRDRAYKLLSVKSYSRNKLIEKLLKYGEPDICEQTADKMEEYGLINDYDYSMALARDMYNLKGFSARKIFYELMKKGIEKEMSKEASEQFDDDLDKERIAAVLEKRVRKSLTDRKERTRITTYLVRMGYSFEDINFAIRDYIENEDE